ncbi:hypothetical protein IH601_09040 [Candidatus Bipolaricaulota bacterium]|nr:hypothetical protein [Candidatus Bipolaricaulota bacterium]TFH08400.1 MAG: hypothetical protein E4H08_07855 [Candidatus Atribacteria bacterium]
MEKVKAVAVILAAVVSIAATAAVGFGDAPGTIIRSDSLLGARDEFYYAASDELVWAVGVSAEVPGGGIIAGIGTELRIDPFFTEGQMSVTLLPAFSATQALKTGIDFDWWSAFVELDLSLAPWGLAATGGWLELHPPVWAIAARPQIALGSRIGWGPQWEPIRGWTHEVDGQLDVQAEWNLETRWNSALDLIAQSDLGVTWTFPGSDFVADWLLALGARSVLPVFQDSPATLRVGATARASVFPGVGFGFDTILEFRANAFYAYGLIGAGANGIRAEVGAELTIGVNMFGQSSSNPDQD